MLQVIFLCN